MDKILVLGSKTSRYLGGEHSRWEKRKIKMKNALRSDMSSMLRHSKGECGLGRRGLGEELRKLTRSQMTVFCRPFDYDFDFYPRWYSGL